MELMPVKSLDLWVTKNHHRTIPRNDIQYASSKGHVPKFNKSTFQNLYEFVTVVSEHLISSSLLDLKSSKNLKNMFTQRSCFVSIKPQSIMNGFCIKDPQKNNHTTNNGIPSSPTQPQTHLQQLIALCAQVAVQELPMDPFLETNQVGNREGQFVDFGKVTF